MLPCYKEQTAMGRRRKGLTEQSEKKPKVKKEDEWSSVVV